MKTFIIRVLFFITLVVVAFSIMAFVNYLLYKSEDLIAEKDRHVLILGDSNIQSAINDSVFKEILSTSSTIDTVLLSFAPHNIFDNGWLLDDKHIYSNFRLYYYIMDWNDFMFLFDKQPRAVIASIPGIGNQTMVNVTKKIIGRTIAPSYGGFFSTDRNILEEVQMRLINGEALPFFSIPENFEISAEEELYLNKIIALCESKQVKLYLINPPKRTELLNYPKYGIQNFNSLYDEKYSQVDYLDFSTLEMPDDCYDDFVHLSRKGSTYFSLLLENEGLEALSDKYRRN